MNDSESFKRDFIDSLSSAELKVDSSEHRDSKTAKKDFSFRNGDKLFNYTLEVTVEFNWKRYFSVGEKNTYARVSLIDKSGEEFSYDIPVNPMKEFILEGVNMTKNSSFSHKIKDMIEEAKLTPEDVKHAIASFKEQVKGFNRSLAERQVQPK